MLNSSNAPCGATAVSPLSPRKREPQTSYLTKIPVCTLVFLSACCGAWSQTPANQPAPADQAAPAATPAAAPPAAAVAPASAQPAAFAIGDLRPILANVRTAVSNLNTPRWKASTEICTH